MSGTEKNLKRMRHGMLFLLCALTIFVGSWGGVPAVKASGAAGSNYKLVGYYTDWGIYEPNFQVEHVDATKLTHLNYAFADLCWNGKHGNPSNDPGNPNRNTWPCTNSGVPTQKGTVPNGAIVLGDPWADVNNNDGVPLEWEDCEKGLCGNFYKLKALKQANPNLKILLSVGGWTWSNRFSDVAADSTARQNFANSAVNILRTYGFDGIDIDWEYPVSGGLPDNSSRPADKHNFTLLLQDTRAKLDTAGTQDGRTYLLTIASRANESYTQTTEISTVAQIVDWINIMTYDFHGNWETQTNNNAPLYSDPADPADATKFYSDGAVKAYQNAGVPLNKIVLGIPLYGVGWKNCAPGPNGNGLYQTCTPDANGSYVPNGTWDTWESGPSGSFDYGDLAANYVNKNGFVRYWNDKAKVPFLYNASSKTFISYDDPQSISAKTSYIQTQGLGGAMVWDLSEDCRTSPKYACTANKLVNQLAAELNIPASGQDTIPPTVPTGVISPSQTSNSITLQWNASQDNVGVAGYDIYNGSSFVARTAATTYTVTGLPPSTTYSFTIKAADAAGNMSNASAPCSVTTLQPVADTEPPTVPKNLTSSAKTDTTVSLTWSPSTDNVAVAGYQVYQGNAQIASVTSTTYTVTGLVPNTSYSFQVKAYDAAGNISNFSSVLTVKTLAVNDTQPPTAPTNLAASAHTATTVSLQWSASTDNIGVTGYDIYNGGTLAGTVNGTTTAYTVTGLSPSTAYTFTVKARDAAGNVSAASAAISVTTDAGGTAPSWASNTAYKVGDEVSYSNQLYICQIAHTSLTGWEPPNVPALWRKK